MKKILIILLLIIAVSGFAKLGLGLGLGLSKGIQSGGVDNPILVCDVAGVAYVAQTKAYGTFEFDFKVTSTSALINRICFIASTNSTSTYSGYLFSISNSGYVYANRIYLQDVNNGSRGVLFYTETDYTADDTLYSLKTVRTADGIFSVYIKGGTFGTTYRSITSLVSGTNPVTNNVHTTSSYLVIDASAGFEVSNIIADGTQIDVNNFITSSGTFSIK